MIEDIYALATTLVGDDFDQHLLELYCKAAVAQLGQQLKPGVAPEDCQELFVTAAAWIAAGFYGQAMETDGVTSFSAGDFSVTKNGVQYGQLRHQAEQLMAPYCKGQMSFLGVAT